MRTKLPTARVRVILTLSAILSCVPAGFGYDQANVATYGAANVEKSATTTPNDLTSFTNAVALAYAANLGGVFNLPSSVTSGTTLFRGTYGAGQGKRLSITSSTPMQNVTSSGSFVPVSSPNGITTTADVSGYSLAVGPVTYATNDLALPEAVVRIGFTVLSRTGGLYPLDVAATVFFSDGTSQSVTANIGGTKGTDDTFYGFAAPASLSITNVVLASFVTGTTTPVNTRIGLDDLGFVTASFIPPPQVLNVSPFNYAVAKAADGVQFDALSYVALTNAGSISLVLNSNDVSSQLVITGNETNRHVAYAGLVANQAYDMLITVSNEAGVASSYSQFYTADSPFTLFDSGGFSDPGLYPLGTLMSFTNGGWAWLAPADAATITDTGEPAHGPVLRQMQMGIDETTYLEFPPLASGTIRISFDARVSNPYVRTIDLGLNVTRSGTQGSFVAWGMITNQFGTNTGEFAYYNGSTWVPLVAVDNAWHHYELTNFISGPGADNFAVSVDGIVVGQLLPWRTAVPLRTPMGRLRLASIRGAVLEYGDIDNLLIQGAPEVTSVAPPPLILNVSPANNSVGRSGDGFQFDAFSYVPIDTAGIKLSLNSNDVSGQLTFSGPSTNRHVVFTGLAANRVYDALIVVSNVAGMVTNTSRFYSVDTALTLVDTMDFSDPALFPLGPLGAVGTNGWSWTPSATDSQIVDSGEPAHGAVLRQSQTGANQTSRLVFTPTLSGVLRIAFDARVSTPYSRTLDISVDTATGGQQASFIAWGVVTNAFGTNSGQFAYYDGTAWVPLLEMDTNWHHYELVNYCGGPYASKWNLAVDGSVVGRLLPWRHNITAQTPLASLRVAAIRGTVGDYGDVDNIVVTVGPAFTAPNAISLQHPVLSGDAFSFSFASQLGVLYTVQTQLALGDSPSDLVTILGDGTVKTVADTNPAVTKFYRVRGQ